MTIVTALPFPPVLVFIADSRASWERTGVHHDNLRKLYPLFDRAVIGFAGSIPLAYYVMKHVRDNERRYRRQISALSIRSDVERWVRYAYREAYRTLEIPDNEKRASFIVGTVEPSRDIVRERPEWVPFIPVLSTTRFVPRNSNPSELQAEKVEVVKTIGLKRKVNLLITEIFHRYNSYRISVSGRVSRDLETQIWAFIEDLMIALRQRRVRTVGGLFQCAILGVDGIQWLSYSVFGGLSIHYINDQYIQVDQSTGEETLIKSIEDWWHEYEARSPKKSLGVESRIHQELAEKYPIDEEEE